MNQLLSLLTSSGGLANPNSMVTTTQSTMKPDDQKTQSSRGLSEVMVRGTDIGPIEDLTRSIRLRRNRDQLLPSVVGGPLTGLSAPIVPVLPAREVVSRPKHKPDRGDVYQLTGMEPMAIPDMSHSTTAEARPMSSPIAEDIQGIFNRGSSRKGSNGDASKTRGDDGLDAIDVDDPQEEEPVRSSQGRTNRGDNVAGLEDASWLKRVKTAITFIEEMSPLQPNNWLDWILDLQDLVQDLDIKDEQAIVAAAIKTKMEKGLKATIRFKCQVLGQISRN